MTATSSLTSVNTTEIAETLSTRTQSFFFSVSLFELDC